MLSQLFRAHGHLCAQHPWEVIIGTVTSIMCFMSMRIYTSDDPVCGWNFRCSKEEGPSNRDVIIFTVTKCVSVFYIYLQFRYLRKLGSVYLLGISCVFTLLSSFVFSVAVVNLIGGDFTDLNEALPFFLLLSDLSKSRSFAKFALSSKSHNEVKKNIGNGMAIIGPALTLDAIVETLVIGIGTISGVGQLETMSCFGCLSVVANYLAFMTFYPACLTLVLELCRGHSHGKPVWQLHQSAKTILEEEEHKKPNPVTQRVKIIMSMGLVLVHAHVRWMDNGKQPDYFKQDLVLSSASTESDGGQEVSSIEADITRMFSLYAKHVITTVLAVFLIVKYLFYDNIDDQFDEHMIAETDKKLNPMESQMNSSKRNDEVDASRTCVKFRSIAENKTYDNESISAFVHECSCQRAVRREAKFSISYDDSSSDDELYLQKESKSTQTDIEDSAGADQCISQKSRPLHECLEIMNSDEGAKSLTDQEILMLVHHRHIPAYKLESMIEDYERGVNIRRRLICQQLKNPDSITQLPYEGYEYKYVNGACCENVIGYIPVPVGYAGPLLLDGFKYIVPMATTEGCLVASTNRGCRALEQSGGVQSTVIHDGMTRGPVVRFPSAKKASEAKFWLEEKDNFKQLKESFDSTSRFARLTKIQTAQAGKNLFIRFVAKTGDAMGMNMVSKGSEKALKTLSEDFPEMDIISLSGNYCTDKKPSAINWIEGRGKSVVCEAVVPAKVVKNLLKTNVQDLIELNISKNYIGSAMAGSLGGFNAHASNIVTAIFIATGQDPAQNVTSSNCITILEATGINNEDLYISCTMPSIEIGTIGGGTVLPPQAACLQMLGLNGSCQDNPGENARKLASLVCGTVLAGELSLLSALAAGHLVRSHLTHNRSSANMVSSANKELSKPDEKLEEPVSKQPS